MIQRIQTLWIAVGITAMVLTFFFPIATLSFEWKAMPTQMNMELIPEPISFESTSLPQNLISMVPLIILEILIIIIATVSIFLYKNRKLQLRVLAFAFLFSVLDLGTMFLFVDRLHDALLNEYAGIVSEAYGVAVYLPMLSIVSFLLAQRAIRKDEALIRSSERIR